MYSVGIMRYTKLSLLGIILSLMSCSHEVKYENIDNDFFSCELVDGWRESKLNQDGDYYQDGRLWLRNSPDEKGEYAIYIRYYDSPKIEKYYNYFKKVKQLQIEKSFSYLKLHCIEDLDEIMSENWIFVTDKCLIDVGYLYPKDANMNIINQYRDIVYITLESLKIK